jgi:ATP-binding cassette subfamily F protein 3
MIALRQVAIRRGGRELLADVDVTLHAGWRVGVVGRNGCGKSSLFAAILGELEPDRGHVERPRAQRIVSVAQETPGLPDPAIEFVLGGDPEAATALAEAARAEAEQDPEAAARAHQRLDEIGAYDARARAGRLLHGLGFKAHTHAHPVADFSGGWRARVNLARALMAPSEALLLDEPTNHLDLDAVVWLEEWLRKYPGLLLVISHDRDFLDGVATHILHVADGGARLYVGNYAAFERQRAEMLRQQQIAFEKEQAERAHLKKFIDRFKAKASKARQAQSRVKRLERMEATAAVRAERGVEIAFEPPARLPEILLRLADVACGYRKDSPDDHDDGAALADAHERAETRVLEAVRIGLEAGERIGLLGPNGEGKSTLIKTIAGRLPPVAGSRIAHKDLVVGYFAQHTVEQLRAGETPLKHLMDLAPGIGEQVARNWLGRWNFVGDRVFEPVDGFSGGERARLALALIAWTRPNLLLPDEPTNHLDLEMREALAEALNDFEGAIVLVSHDRSLLGLVCDRFWRVADGRVEPFDGDLDDYARWLRQRRSPETESAAATTSAPAGKGSATSTPVLTGQQRRKLAAERRERERPLRRRLAAIDARLATLARETAALDARLTDPEVVAALSGPELAALAKRQGELRAERAALEDGWLEVGAELEALTTD